MSNPSMLFIVFDFFVISVLFSGASSQRVALLSTSTGSSLNSYIV